jgi:hypothetical protein
VRYGQKSQNQYFTHISVNSQPFPIIQGVILKGIHRGIQLYPKDRLQPAFFSVKIWGNRDCDWSQPSATATEGPVFSGLVRSSCGLFPVLVTGPRNTNKTNPNPTSFSHLPLVGHYSVRNRGGPSSRQPLAHRRRLQARLSWHVAVPSGLFFGIHLLVLLRAVHRVIYMKRNKCGEPKKSSPA